MFKRSLYRTILPQLGHKNAILITGMRQVGKTTLMRLLSDAWKGKKIWFDFDNPLDHLLFENVDYNAVYTDLRQACKAGKDERFLVCIDEIQNFPEITKVIKYLIDHYGTKFILTGSSNFYLRNLFPESLSGRKFLYILNPLSYKEFLYFKNELTEEEIMFNRDDLFLKPAKSDIYRRQALYDEYMLYGGFPEIALTTDPDTKILIIKNIFSSFFEKDIQSLSTLKDVKELRDLILLLGPRNGNMLDITRLSSELGVNRVKIYSYLEFLEATFFLKLIPKYTSSIDRSVAGGKKVYFSDSGMLNMVSRVNDGQLLECTVANQLAPYGKLSFFNKRNTAEIDFILDRQVAFEVKQKAVPSDLNKLKKYAQDLGLEKYYVVSNTVVDIENVIYPWFM